MLQENWGGEKIGMYQKPNLKTLKSAKFNLMRIQNGFGSFVRSSLDFLF